MCARLAQQLPAKGDCSAYAAGLVVYVPELDRGFLPDLVVICGPAEEAPGKRTPVIVVSGATGGFQMNKALEAADVKVRETDLGEYILQINDNERPSHIIAPVVHKDKEQAERDHDSDHWDGGTTE